MATLLTARNLTKVYPSKVLFEGVSISVESGDRIGLIGPNGSGKSTLLKILAGGLDADEGTIERRRGLRAAYVDQEDRFPGNATPLSVVCDAVERAGGADVDPETRAAIALTRLGFAEFDCPVLTLSGGWRKRVSLARALATDPDVLMLDEPTNHLDMEGVVWLERWVRESSVAMVFVTHDRLFLENTTTRIVELSAAYPGGSFEVAGNYSSFVRRKEEYLEAQVAARASIASRVRRDTAWLRQGVQGRQTRNSSQVKAAERRRAELDDVTGRTLATGRRTSIEFEATARKTTKLLVLRGVSKSMGSKRLFDSLDVALTPGQRVGLLGPNGAGKTTLMRIMSGETAVDSGAVERAERLRIVTFSQHRESLAPGHSLRQALCPIGETVHYRGTPVHVRGWASRFLFDADQLDTRIGDLSGGEQARVLIANLMLTPADVLLMDEPTNDLDIPSLEVLERSLMEFPGSLVLVSHDRFLLERVSTEFLALDGSGGARWFASMDQWRAAQAASVVAAADDEKVTASAQKREAPTKSKKLSYKYQREYDGMEEAILRAEDDVVRLEEEAGDPALADDYKRAESVYAQLKEAHDRVERLYARWSELESMHTAD